MVEAVITESAGAGLLGTDLRTLAADFVAIDFETANPDCASICQVGVVAFRNGQVIAAFDSLIDPEDSFSRRFVAIHGIAPADVRGAPIFSAIYDRLRDMVTDQVVVCHTPFDRNALRSAIAKYRLPALECHWLDSAEVTRYAWPQFAHSGYSLANITAFLGIASSITTPVKTPAPPDKSSYAPCPKPVWVSTNGSPIADPRSCEDKRAV
jgi:DNA polymerase III epsilon subunit-like protein